MVYPKSVIRNSLCHTAARNSNNRFGLNKFGDYSEIHQKKFGDLENKLFYHTWHSETPNHNYEMDFRLSRGTKLWPLEVKSSGYNTHKSLDEFCKEVLLAYQQQVSHLHQGVAQRPGNNPSSCVYEYVPVIVSRCQNDGDSSSRSNFAYGVHSDCIRIAIGLSRVFQNYRKSSTGT